MKVRYLGLKLTSRRILMNLLQLSPEAVVVVRAGGI